MNVPETQPAYLVSKVPEETALQIAELFAQMKSNEQAIFFDRVAEISEQWVMPAVFQWRFVQKDLTKRAKNLIDDIKDNTDDE